MAKSKAKKSGASHGKKAGDSLVLKTGKVKKRSAHDKYNKKLRSNVRAAAAAKARGKTAQTLIRGDVVSITVPSQYRKGYTAADLVKACKAIQDGVVTRTQMWQMERGRKPRAGAEPYARGTWKALWKVPPQTVVDHLKLGEDGKAKWRHVEASNQLRPCGGEAMLGDAEPVLAAVVAIAHRQGTPFAKEDIVEVARSTAMKIGALDARGCVYTVTTDLRKWFNAFLVRCQSVHGVDARMRRGHMISDVRTQVVSRESVEYYRDYVHAPALQLVKERHASRGSQMSLENNGNFDEWMLDMNSFAEANAYLVITNEQVNVRVPFERCPHITVIAGFMGSKPLQHLLILPRKNVPHEYGALLTSDVVGIAGSESGWVNHDLKTEWFRQVINSEDNIIGREPTLLSFDGHSTNVNNLELAVLMMEHDVVGIATPSHHTHVLQPCDTSASKGGPIARVKKVLNDKIRIQTNYQIRTRGECEITMTQLAKLLQDSIDEALTPEVCMNSLTSVGYYMDKGEVKYDPVRVVDARLIPSKKAIDQNDMLEDGALRSGRFKRPLPSPLRPLKAKNPDAVAAACEAIAERMKPQVAEDPNKGKKRGGSSKNTNGVIITRTSHINSLAAEKENAEATKTRQDHAKWSQKHEQLKRDVDMAEKKSKKASKTATMAAKRIESIQAVVELSQKYGESESESGTWWQSGKKGGLTAPQVKDFLFVVDGVAPQSVDVASRERVVHLVGTGHGLAEAHAKETAAAEMKAGALAELDKKRAELANWLVANTEPPRPPRDEDVAEAVDGSDAVDDASAGLTAHADGGVHPSQAPMDISPSAPRHSLSAIKRLTPRSQQRELESMSPTQQRNLLMAFCRA